MGKKLLNPSIKNLNKLINKTCYIFKISSGEFNYDSAKIIYRAFKETDNLYKVYDLSYIIKNDDDTVQIIYDNDNTGPIKRGILTLSLNKISEAYKHSKAHTPFFDKYRTVIITSNMNNKYIFVIPRFNIFRNRKYEEREVTEFIWSIYWH